MFKSKKIKYIEKVIESCVSYSQWLSCCKWLDNLYDNDIISLSQTNNLSFKNLYQLDYISDLENHQRRLVSV